MAIRIIFLFLLSLTTHANFNEAVRYYKANKFLQSIDSLKKSEGKKVRNYSTKSLFLLAKNMEKLKRHKDAIKIHFFIIRKSYRKQDKLVRTAIKNKMDYDEIESLQDGLKKIYLNLLYVYLNIYEEFRYENYKNLINSFAELLLTQDYKTEEVEKITQRLSFVDKNFEALKIKNKFYIGLGYSLWQDQINLISPSGKDSTIYSNVEGTTIYSAWTRGDSFRFWKYEFAITFAKATVGEDSSEFEYFQSGVNELMLSANIGYMFYLNEAASIGVNVPILYRSGDFTQPGDFEIKNATIISTGVLGNLNWEMDNTFLDFKMGKLLKFKSSFVQLSFGFKF